MKFKKSRHLFEFQFSMVGVLRLVAVVCVLLAIVAAISRSAWWHGGIRPRPFNSDMWKTAELSYGDHSVRSAMVDSLLRRHDFHGWSRDEVLSLLGNPDSDLEGDPYDLALDDCEFGYFLGLPRGWAPQEEEALVFVLDSDDRVVDYGCRIN